MTEGEFIHPETGEILATKQEWEQALAALEERLAPLYRLRRVLRDEWATRYSPPGMPAPRYWTDAQAKVARCPRCGIHLKGDLEKERGAES